MSKQSARVRMIPQSTILLVLLAACSARGDLYTDGVLTLDWLVDSADEIHLVRFVPRESEGGFVSEPLETLKPKSGKSALAREDVENLSPPLQSPRSGEWLFFVHVTEKKQVALCRGISLDHPIASYKTAAFTRDGRPLRDRDAILATTEARIAFGRSLPPRCNQMAVEALRRLASSNGMARDSAASYPFGDPAPVEQYVGGMLVQMSCDDWDDPDNGPYDADTWLNVAVVPVEPDDHERLLKAAPLGKEHEVTPRYCHPVACLVNFPGKKTEECLRQIIQDRFDRRTSDYLTAVHVLWYHHYRLEVTDPLNKQLVGSWRLEGQRERIDVELMKDNTFTARAWDFDQSPYTREIPRRTWQGKGYWVVRGGRLSIFRTHCGSHSVNKWGRNEREIFRDKPVLEVTDTAVVLKSGPPMTRKKAPRPPYAKSPSPDHIEIRTDLADCPRFRRTQRLTFVTYDMVFDGGSLGAEFRNQSGQKVTLLFANREYWNDEAKKQNVQPVLFHFYDEPEKVNRFYEVVWQSDEETRIAALLQRAIVGLDGLRSGGMTRQERLTWLAVRLRDRRPVVLEPTE